MCSINMFYSIWAILRVWKFSFSQKYYFFSLPIKIKIGINSFLDKFITKTDNTVTISNMIFLTIYSYAYLFLELKGLNFFF